MKYSDIKSVEDVRGWLLEHPDHIISDAWYDMLNDMDTNGEEPYTLEDFFKAADYQMFGHGGELAPDEVV